MKVMQFIDKLKDHSEHEIRFILPNGNHIPLHAHVTEVGRTDRCFIDCGGTVRQTSTCTLQVWVGDDLDHRLSGACLAKIMTKSLSVLGIDKLNVEIEYEVGSISQFRIVDSIVNWNILDFHLGAKHTDCLAKEICMPNNDEELSCSEGKCC
jgi:hypothetical protein